MNELELTLSKINHFQFIHKHLFTSGCPEPTDLLSIKEYGVSTLINIALIEEDRCIPHEDKRCLEIGLNYIHLPISFDMPSVDQCILVLDLIDHLVKEQMVWVHCQDNLHASCLMYLYRQYYMDIDIATAQELLHEIWEPNETWTGLIHAVTLQLQGRKATQDLQSELAAAD